MSVTSSIPARIGRFQVRARLGSGAFADVYRAHDPQLARDVAVKVVRDGVLSDATAVQRFLREGKVAARLCHPHIVSVFDAGQDGGRYYLAASFIDGQTLAQRLKGDPLNLRAAAVLVRDLAEALQHAHQTGVIHRDVKPANILLDSGGGAHLADFGLAHVGEALEKLTQDGTVLGSPAYMAPELAAGGAASPLPASDQYSLGVVLYELLCGRAPFEGAPAKVLHDAIHTPPIPPRQVKAAVPADLETICLKALAKRPEDRYADCQALADDLRRWLEGEPIRARRLSLVEQLARWFRREPKVAWTSLGAACCLLFAALTPLLASSVLGVVLAKEKTERAHLESATHQATTNAADADEQRRRAEDATAKAKAATADAQQKQHDLEEARKRLPAEQDKQEKELKRLEQEQIQRRHAQYAADVNLAFQEFADQKLDKMLALLKRHQSESGQEDLRGFEWYYLVEQARRPTTTPTVAGQQSGSIYFLHFTGDGPALVAASFTEHKSGKDLTTDYQFRYYARENSPAGGYTLTGIVRDKPVLISPDGRKAVVQGDSIASSRVIDTRTGKVLGTLEKHKKPITQGAFSADAKWLATLHAPEPEVRIWDLEAHKEVVAIEVPGCKQAVLSHDGKTLATALPDGKVQLWESASGKKLPLLLEKPDSVTSWISFAPDDKGLLVAGEKTVILWNLADGKQSKLQGAWPDEPIVFSPDGKRIAALLFDSTKARIDLSIWDTATGTKLATSTEVQLESPARYVSTCAFSPDGRLIVAIGKGSNQKVVYVYEAATLRLRAQLPIMNPVKLLAFSAKGDFLAAGGSNGQIIIWKREQFEQPTTISGLPAALSAMVVVPQGQTIAVSHGKAIELLDQKTGFQLAVLPEQSGDVTCLATAAQGDILASGAKDGVVKLWNVTTRKVEKELSGPGSPIRSLTVSANGRIIAAGRENGTFTLWDCDTGKLLPGPVAQKVSSRSLAVTSDGNLLAWTDDNMVKMWDVRAQHEIGVLTGQTAPVAELAIAPDGKMLVTVGFDRTRKLWDLASRKERTALHGPKVYVERILFSPDGKTIIAFGDQTVRLWEATTGLELGTLQRADHSFDALAFVPQGNMLISASKNGTLDFWTADHRANPFTANSHPTFTISKSAMLLKHTSTVQYVAFSPDGGTLASVCRTSPADRTIKLWSVATGQERAILKDQYSSAHSVAFSPDGTLALGCNEIGWPIRLLDITTGKEQATFYRTHTNSVFSLAFSPDGQTLASASEDQTIKLWSVTTGKQLAVLKRHTSEVTSVAFSPDGQILASGSEDKSIKLWDVKTSKELSTLTGHQDTVRSVVFSPDGNTLASASSDKTIMLWDIKTRKEFCTLKGHMRVVYSVAFSPDGKTLASGSGDNTIKLWNVATGEELATLKEHSGSVTCVAFSPDGKTLASASADKTISLWDVGPGKEP